MGNAKGAIRTAGRTFKLGIALAAHKLTGTAFKEHRQLERHAQKYLHNPEYFTVDFQFHPYENIWLGDVLEVMETKGLDCLACLEYDWEEKVSNDLLKEEPNGYELQRGEHVIVCTNKDTGWRGYILRGREHEAKPSWHFLAIGADLSRACVHIEDYIEGALSKGGIPIFDHAFANPLEAFADIGREKEIELREIAGKYRQEIAYDWNGYCLPWVRGCVPGYGDVNAKLEKLASEFSLRITPTSDTHARSRKIINGAGEAFVAFPYSQIELSDEKLLFRSMSNALREGNYEQHRQYVSFQHLWKAFLWPQAKRMIAL